MSTNYSEQIFQSIDTIVSQRLNEVSFNKTEICKIANQNKDYPNKYQVTNEAGLKYEAYSSDDNKKYLEGQKIYVLVPQGNYELRKLIIGSYSTDEIPENLYVNPFNHLITSSTLSLPSSIWAKVNSEEYDEWDDIPSNEIKSNSVEFLTNFKYKNIQDFDYIGLDFSFNTNIIGYQGSYALKISLWNGETELTNENDNTLVLSSKNLYGNPYNLNSSLSFQHLFPWPTRKKDNKIEPIPITEITKIKLQLIQDNNFLREQGGNNVNINSWIELVKADLKFGYDIKSITNDELQLILQKEQDLKYTTNDTISKRVYLNWQHFDNNNTPFIFNIDQIPNIFEYYNIYWLHYVDGLGKNPELDDSLAWNWETISKNKNMQQTLDLTTLYNTDQYKVVIQYKYKNNEQIYNAVSNAIIFENTQVTAEPGATNNSEESLRLSLAEGDTGIYNVYGLDGRMVDTSKKSHIITAAFLDGTSWDDKKIEKVTWKFPESNTMILNGAQDLNNKNKATFDINGYYKPGAMNNRIWCEVKFITGAIRRGSLTLQFGEISTAGTSYAFNIDFVGHNTCVYTNSTNKVKVKATFEKVNGEAMTMPAITWSWVTSNSYKNNDPLISGSGIKIEGSGDEIQLSYSGTTVPSGNYSILQATISNYAIDNGLTSNLTAYLPIPIADKNYSYISGATRLVYAMDNQSVSKSNDDYRLYQINNNKEAIEVENTSWNITSHSSTLDGIPQLRKTNEKIKNKNVIRYTIRPVSYTSLYIPLVNINCEINKKIVWSQPILILSNAWESDEINDWNGVVEIDDKDGNIKAPFFIAGKKEKVTENGQSANRLTGLVIGDLDSASVASGTGIYGFYQGKPRYYLTDSGKFYVGNDNDNFISFNEGVSGRSSTGELMIKTNKFNLSTSKLEINSNNGIKLLDTSGNTRIELNNNGTATIGGWNITSNSIQQSKDGKITGIQQPGSGAVAITVAATTNSNWATAPFYVTHAGKLYASGAEIDGKFTLSAGSKMNGNDISEYSTFSATKTSIVATVGKTLESYATLKVLEDKISAVVKNGDKSFGWDLNATSWTLKANGKNLLYANKNGITIYGKLDIENGASINGQIPTGNLNVGGIISAGSADIKGIVKATEISASKITAGTTSATITMSGNVTISGNLTVNGTGTIAGCKINSSGKLIVNNGNISSLDVAKVKIGNEKIKFETYTVNTENDSFRIYANGNNRDPYFCVTPVNIGIYGTNGENQSSSINVGKLIGDYDLRISSFNGLISGTWYRDGEGSLTSDENKKNSIEILDNRYEILFDNLTPRRFRFNDGTSGRFHTGFISQEVGEALFFANIDTKEFSGYVVKHNKDNTDDYYLRYENFISLNTWQIQKLKARVAELEKEIKEIKQNEI